MIKKWNGSKQNFLAAVLACASIMAIGVPLVHAEQGQVPQLTAKDLATANGSARIGSQSGNLCCVLTSIETRVQLSPDSWASDDEATNWTAWLTEFDNNLYSNWLKNAPANAQETIGLRINPDSSINITNGTFLPSPSPSNPASADSKTSFETAIAASLSEALKAAKPMPQTKNKLKELHMSLTFMRDPKVVPRYGKNALGFVAVLNDKGAITVSERTKDGRFPGIEILTNRDDGKVEPLEQGQFDQAVAEIEKSL